MPAPGNKGGLDELVIPDPMKQVRVDRVSGANPEFQGIIMSVGSRSLLPGDEIRFVGEQCGIVENELKEKLIDIFQGKKNSDQPSRAYLAKIKYEASRESSVALCIPILNDGEQILVNEIANIFRDMFGAHEYLDIIFISNLQERKLRKICCPFYCTKYFENPDFYLSSSEGYGLEQVRACYKEKRLMNDHPDGYILCKIEPSIFGQPFGLGDQMINKIIISSRHANHSIFIVEEWPVYVHVMRLVDEINPKIFSITENMMRPIGWAEIYDTYVQE